MVWNCGRLHNFGGLKPQNNQRLVSLVAPYHETGGEKNTEQNQTNLWSSMLLWLTSFTQNKNNTRISYENIKMHCNFFFSFLLNLSEVSDRLFLSASSFPLSSEGVLSSLWNCNIEHCTLTFTTETDWSTFRFVTTGKEVTLSHNSLHSNVLKTHKINA